MAAVSLVSSYGERVQELLQDVWRARVRGAGMRFYHQGTPALRLQTRSRGLFSWEQLRLAVACSQASSAGSPVRFVHSASLRTVPSPI